MNLSKCVIGSKTNYSQTVYCEMGEALDDKSSVLLGFKNSIPVLSNSSANNCKESPSKKVLKVEVDPKTGEKFINLNGKKLRMVPESEIPTHIKKNTQTMKINSPAHADTRAPKGFKIIGKMMPSLIHCSSKLVTIPKSESLDYFTSNKNDICTTALSQNPLIKDGKVINIKKITTDIDRRLKTADKSNSQITQDKGSCLKIITKTENESAKPKSKAFIKFCTVKVPKSEGIMQALDLTKHLVEKSLQTDKTVLVDASVQTDDLPDSKISFGEELLRDYEGFNEDLGLDAIISNTLDPLLSSTPKRITYEEDAFAKQVRIFCSAPQVQARNNHAARFFTELRSALVPDDKGNMPIHVGVLMNCVNSVKRSWLILKILGQSIDLMNNSDYSPLQLAIMHEASKEIVTFLLSNEARLDLCDLDGNNLIHLAVEYHRTDALPTLLDYAGKQNILDQFNHEGLTPLMICASNSQHQCAEILLDYDADVNVRDQISGRTALFHAAENQDLAMVQLLLNNQADTKVKNFFGTSPHDAMYEVEDMPDQIRSLILGKSSKRKSNEDHKSSGKSKKKDDKKELKTYARLEKINNFNMAERCRKKWTVIRNEKNGWMEENVDDDLDN